MPPIVGLETDDLVADPEILNMQAEVHRRNIWLKRDLRVGGILVNLDAARLNAAGQAVPGFDSEVADDHPFHV